jgi:hypothetical protein
VVTTVSDQLTFTFNGQTLDLDMALGALCWEGWRALGYAVLDAWLDKQRQAIRMSFADGEIGDAFLQVVLTMAAGDAERFEALEARVHQLHEGPGDWEYTTRPNWEDLPGTRTEVMVGLWFPVSDLQVVLDHLRRYNDAKQVVASEAVR